MTTTAVQRPSSVENPDGEQPDQSRKVNFNVDELVVGQQLKCPIYDEKGSLLLLAHGSIVTQRFKQVLLERGIRAVTLSQVDADGIIAHQLGAPAGQLTGTIPFDPGLTQKLDELIDAGQLFQANAGPKLRERLVRHSGKGRNIEQRAALLAHHSQTCTALDNLIKVAAHGEHVSGQEIAKAVSNYLTSMMGDADRVLAVARQAVHYADVAEHCLQMSLFGMALGIELKMGEGDIRNIGLSGLLHDWGMTRVPLEILNANRILTQAEFLEIKKHPTYTLDLLKTISTIPDLVPMICYQVHERPDGSGYPRGRKRRSIHPGARVLHVADVYLALITPRPFRKPLMPYVAVECLLRQAAENLVDVEVVRALLHVVSLFPIGSHVMLSDGSTARVLRRNGTNYSSPITRIIRNADGEPTDPADESQIIDPSARNLEIVKAIPVGDDSQFDFDASAAEINRE